MYNVELTQTPPRLHIRFGDAITVTKRYDWINECMDVAKVNWSAVGETGSQTTGAFAEMLAAAANLAASLDKAIETVEDFDQIILEIKKPATIPFTRLLKKSRLEMATWLRI